MCIHLPPPPTGTPPSRRRRFKILLTFQSAPIEVEPTFQSVPLRMLIELLRMAQFFLFPTVQNFKRLLSLPFFSYFPPLLRFPLLPAFFLFSLSIFQSPFPPSFPLCIRPWPRPPNARVNIIMCMPFLCSSSIQEFYVLQHPYDSTLQLLSSKIIQKKSDLSLEHI